LHGNIKVQYHLTAHTFWLKGEIVRHSDVPTRHFALRLPEALWQDIIQLAQQEKRSINAQILIMLERATTTLLPPPRRTKPAKTSESA